MTTGGSPTNRWYVLILSTGTLLLCAGVIIMSLSVLFKEISEELELNLVQIGVIWSSMPFAGLFVVFLGGILIDRLGIKRMAIITCLLSGVLGASRGLANDFWTLALTTFTSGLAGPIIVITMHRAATIWFSGRQLGLANGVLAAGMGVGFALGAMISASLLSPWLGSWRYVLFLYGGISIVIGLIWLFTVQEPRTPTSPHAEARLSLRQMISGVIQRKDLWLLGLSLFGFMGCIYSIQGYLPLYLREIGWSPLSADGALAALNFSGAISAVPLALLSDKLGLRKAVLLPLIATAAVSAALLAVFDNAIVWLLAVLIGVTRDGSVALFVTMNQEKVAGSEYSGTALGFQNTVNRGGNIIAPALGNSLASISLGTPFLLWAAFAAVGATIMAFIKESRR